MKHMNKAVDDVRNQESKKLQAQGNHDLKRSKYLWLCGEENISDYKREEFETLKNKTFKVAKAWPIKEMLRELWGSANLKSAIHYFLKWFEWARNSGLKPVRKALRPVAVGRKNWLFVGSEASGQNTAILLTFTQTCRALKINRYEYYAINNPCLFLNMGSLDAYLKDVVFENFKMKKSF